MKTLANLLFVLLLAGAVFAQGKGIKPRSKPVDYPASTAVNGATIGAAQLSAKQVRQAFATDVHDGYVVVEIGIYPKEGEVAVDPQNFFLRVEGTSTMLRPAEPKTIAAVLQKPTGRDVTLYPTANVGYSSGPVYGPYGTVGNQSGVTRGVGLGVGINPKEKKSDADRKVMETELADKALPAGKFTKPVSGHLYFPVSTSKNVRYILEYESPEWKLSMNLPLAEK